MNYTVIWMPATVQQLADLWLAAPDRNAVSRASFAIDVFLETTPNAVGMAVFDTVREFAHPPLAVEYEVSDPDRLVSVFAVWDSALGRSNPTGN